MDSIKFITFLFQSLLLFSGKVHKEPDEAMWDNTQKREVEINQEVTRLMEMMERSQMHLNLVPSVLQQRLLEYNILSWEAVLLVAIAAGLVLLLWRCRWLRKRTPRPDSLSNMCETSNMSIGDENEEESDEEDPEELTQGGRISARHIEWPVQKMLSRSRVVKYIVDDLLQFMQDSLSKSFMPVLQPAIGVGSAFEGWSPYDADDVVYHLLVPLKPPTGHTFHLQWGTRGPMAVRDSHIHVEVECTCWIQNMPCFVHHSRKHLERMKQASSLLDTVCTGSYLDVQKLAEWFQCLVKKAWAALPQARYYEMKVLPYSQRSCLMKLKSAYNNCVCFIEILFGVQQGDSDIFLTSQSAGDANTQSTLWVNSYLVAEEKFFSHVARQVPHGSLHLKCLCLCTSILDDTNFTPYILKTVVMHLLNAKPMSRWCRRESIMRLADILKYLHCSLEQKKLNFFFFGNGKMPQEIILPPDFQTSEPHNLLQYLVQSPATHAEALRQFDEIQERLINRLYKGGLNRESQLSCSEICHHKCVSLPGQGLSLPFP